VHVAHTVKGSGVYFFDGGDAQGATLPHQNEGVAVHQPVSHLTIPPRRTLASCDAVAVVIASNPAAADHVYFIENDDVP
jgi:hypothetical protein